MTSLLIYWIQRGKPLWAGLLLGFSVHFKIYPFIYTPSILLALDTQYDRAVFARSQAKAFGDHPTTIYTGLLVRHVNKSRIQLCVGAAIGFLAPTLWMYNIYGHEFLHHSYLHHASRLDHRHNFSPYHLALYLSSALPKQAVSISSLAFIPQLLLAGIVIPLALIGKDLGTIMFTQTFAFVAFNKVCTSQVSQVLEKDLKGKYFMWYISFLPLYLPTSRFLQYPGKGILALVSWILAQVYVNVWQLLTHQAAWLYYGYRLEILGDNVFFPQLWSAGMAFFAVNVGILGNVLSSS